ncbi:MAG: hypothetical protein JKP98_05870 [Rhodobacteraceae bacterium]|nr:hypothetical protein [Paracoccaceae bacterium]
MPETPLGKRLDAVETAMAAAHPWRREEEWVSATGDRFVRVFSDGLIWHRDRSEGPEWWRDAAPAGPRHADRGLAPTDFAAPRHARRAGSPSRIMAAAPVGS